MGTLRITGKVSVAQFWPSGTSDADTIQLEIEVEKNPFAYAMDDKKFTVTKVFDNAYVLGRGGRKEIIKTGKNKVSKITIRLQGIDAPELHYTAPPLKASDKITPAIRKKYNEWNEEFCQAYAEFAAHGLGSYLQKRAGKGKTHITASFYSRNIEEPADVLDTNGRFVGTVMIGKTDLNLWLARQGVVVPTFYNSMLPDEISTITKACHNGKAKKTVWNKQVTNRCTFFQKKRLYRRPPRTYVPGSDKGKVLVPKLFRRVVNFKVEKASGVFKNNWLAYVLEKGKADTFYDLSDYLDQGVHSATVHRISDFVVKNTFTKDISQIVFTEGPSTLKRKSNDQKIKSF